MTAAAAFDLVVVGSGPGGHKRRSRARRPAARCWSSSARKPSAVRACIAAPSRARRCRRQRVGEYLPPLTLDDPSLRQFLAAQGWPLDGSIATTEVRAGATGPALEAPSPLCYGRSVSGAPPKRTDGKRPKAISLAPDPARVATAVGAPAAPTDEADTRRYRRGGASADFLAAASELVETGRELYGRGWAFATSGNFSRRVAGDVAITMSGRDKGRLVVADIMLVDGDGDALHPADARPSAETPLHCQLYRLLPSVGAVLHVHSPAATVVSRAHAGDGAVRLAGYEMLKALAGVTTHDHVEVVPILENSQNMARLAAEVERLLEGQLLLHGYLIAGHGLYAWGIDLAEARRHVEALEFLCDCELRSRGRQP